jgi:large subunit ribosomal protein L9
MVMMRVILQEKVKKLGKISDEVSVAAGYARNFLLPQKIAVAATPENRIKVGGMRDALEAKAVQLLEAAKLRAEKMQNITLTMSVNAMPEGKLYGSVGAEEVVNALRGAGHEADKKEVVLPEGPLKTVGEFDIILQVHADIGVPMKLLLQAEA